MVECPGAGPTKPVFAGLCRKRWVRIGRVPDPGTSTKMPVGMNDDSPEGSLLMSTLLSRLLIALVLALPASGLMAQERSSVMSPLAPMIERVMPGVVSISVKGRLAQAENPLLNDPFFRRFFGNLDPMQLQKEYEAAGSGVIVDAEKGYILTNNHVVENADEITIVLSDERRTPAKMVGKDPATDLAVLQVDAKDLQALPLGNSDELNVGDFVVAIGNPFGLRQTATFGIVSALGRTGLGIEPYEDFIQTDASINPGNSGGALVDVNGDLIGINSAIIGPSGGNVGIGFAIPINMAEVVMRELIEQGEVRRGRLGVSIENVTPELASALGLEQPDGALVKEVTDGSPAQAAGIMPGDVIVSVDGEPIRKAADLRLKMALTRVGTDVRLTYVRNGETREATAKLAGTQAVQASGQSSAQPSASTLLAGVSLEQAQGNSGARVTAVSSGSPAGRAGLRVGDIIVSANQKPAETPEQVQSAAAEGKTPLLLQVKRDNTMVLIVIS